MSVTAQPLTYEAALARIAAIAREEESPRLSPVCRSFALTHGERTDRCTVLIHGYTNCPQQFRAFAEQLHARGQNVYVPRMPYHGLRDRMAPDHARIDRAALLTYLDEALRVAHGLGATVGVVGISAGAVLAAYAAQFRTDAHQAVVIAPVLGTPTIPAWATLPLARAARVLPNQFRWWDPVRKDARRSPAHCYPRYSTRVLGSVVCLGFEVLRAAQRRPPAATDIVVVSNAADEAVTEGPIRQLAAAWRRHGARVREHRFPAELGLIHDVIDPAQERQQIALVYPVLLNLTQPASSA
ncbi:MAG: hypothetical protein OHK0015_52220 [Chloroflexi bacterium OHK40]